MNNATRNQILRSIQRIKENLASPNALTILSNELMFIESIIIDDREYNRAKPEEKEIARQRMLKFWEDKNDKTTR